MNKSLNKIPELRESQEQSNAGSSRGKEIRKSINNKQQLRESQENPIGEQDEEDDFEPQVEKAVNTRRTSSEAEVIDEEEYEAPGEGEDDDEYDGYYDEEDEKEKSKK